MISKETIKAVIIEKQQEISAIQLIRRPVKFEREANYVLVGIRRAGKTYQMYQDMQDKLHSGTATVEDFLYLNFEDERLAGISASELGVILDCYGELYGPRRPYIYLDEIQNIEGWEKFGRRLADGRHRTFITGSNARMLSREIATTLGGRYIVREVFTFNFREFLDWHGIALDDRWLLDGKLRNEVRRLFSRYFRYGGFSETFRLDNPREWINSLYQKILLGDLVARNEIRNPNAVQLLTRKLAESVMQPTTHTRLVNIIKSTGINIARATVSEYLSLLQDVYLTFDIPNFADAISGRANACKRYFHDNGLLNNFFVSADARLLENLVAIRLQHLTADSAADEVFYYNKGVEVDFYVPRLSTALQVSLSILDEPTRQRELRSLVRFSNAFPVDNLIIITLDEKETVTTENGRTIHVIPIWEWLLS